MPQSVELTEAQFSRICALVKNLSGISLHSGKKELVKARLNKRLRKRGLSNYDEYIDCLKNDAGGDELTAMLDAISTNLTSFFREADHFEYLVRGIIGPMVAGTNGARNRLRIWSAGCSSGEEPYSIAISACDAIPNVQSWDAGILATDLSVTILDRAKRGVYPGERIETVSPQLRNRYFTCIEKRPQRLFQVKGDLRKLVHFARLNLMGPWPMRGPFDAIFCRNVMIYFDKPTQNRLVERFWEILSDRGTLFVGHSESLTGLRHRFRYVQPTIYEKA